MKIAIIGASGFVGTQLISEALQRGHQVTALARHPEKITIQHPNLTAAAVDVMDTNALAQQLAGHQVILSAYNAGWQNPNLYQDFIAGSQSIQTAAKKSGIKRLLVVGGAGSLYIAPGLQLVDSPQFPAEWKQGATAARDYLNELKQEQELDWTFLSPAIEMHPGTSGKRLGQYRTQTDSPIFDADGKSRISVEDLAVAILDEAEKGAFIKQRFTVAY